MSQFIKSIKAWIEEPDFKNLDDNQSAFYLQVVTLIMIFGAAAIGVSSALAKQWNYVLLIAIDIFVNGAILLMIRRKLLKPATNLFLVFTLAFLTYGILLGGGIHSLSSVLYPLILIFASLLLERKAFIAYWVLCVSSIGGIVFAEHQGITAAYVPDPPHFPLFFAFSLMILGSALLIRFITESLQDNLRKTRQHERELTTQKEILERVGQAVVACFPDDTIFYWNKASSSHYGWSTEEALGKKYNDLLPVSASPETLEAIRTDLRTGKVWSGELLIQKRDGTFLPTLSTLAPLHNKEGKMSGWVGISADLSERKQVEETLRESEDRFKAVFDYSIIGKSVTRLSGQVEVNRAFCEMVGYSPEELQNRKWQEFTHPDDIELTQREIDTLLSGEKDETRFVKRFIHKNGSIVWVDLSSALRRDKNGKPLYLMTSLINITEQKRAEAFRVQAEIDLRTAAMRQHLLDFSRDLLSTVNLTEVFQIIRRTASELVPHDIFRPYWLNEAEEVMLPADEQFGDPFPPKWKIPLGQGIMGDVLTKQQAECVNNSHLDPRSVYPPGAREQISQEHGIFIPIHEGEKMIGVLTLLRRTLPAFTQDEFELMQLLMSLAELALSNARMFADLEQRVAERTAQLATSEERYRLISTVSSDYMFSSQLNAQGQMALDWVAGAFESITGYTFDEYVARGGWLATLHPEDLEQDMRDMAALSANQPVTTEVRTNTKAGQVRWVRVYAHPLWDAEKNQLVGIYGAVQDITAHKQAEIREEQRRAMLEKVVNLGKKIAGVTSLRDCLLEIHRSIQHELEFDRVGLFLYDAVNGQVQGTFGTDASGNLEDISNYVETIIEGDAWQIALKNPNGMYLIDNFGKKSRNIIVPKMRKVTR
jgi:PAS domain S-box-containing protein